MEAQPFSNSGYVSYFPDWIQSVNCTIVMEDHGCITFMENPLPVPADKKKLIL